jgi:hypothetical protein
MALVGGGQHPKFPMNKVIIWDDHQYKCIGELPKQNFGYGAFVKAVRLRKDKIVVVLEPKIFVYNFADITQKPEEIDTCWNPEGLCSISYDLSTTVLAIPDKK